MKKSLKKSEIIENLHRVLPLVGNLAIDVPLFSIIQLDTFRVRYVLVVKYGTIYQTVFIELTYGWIEYTIGSASKDLSDVKNEYETFICGQYGSLE